MSFRNRLALFLMASLVCVQAATAVFAYAYLRRHFIGQGRRDLVLSMQAFTRQMGFLSQRASDRVEVLALDYALRAAIAKSDHETELSVLRNHGDRIGAARMMLVTLEGTIAADTSRPQSSASVFPFHRLLGAAVLQDRGTALVARAGRLYWIVAVPVRAPAPIAFIAAWIPVDGALLEQMRRISASSHAILLATRTGKGAWSVAARSKGDVASALPAIPAVGSDIGVVGDGGAEYLAIAAPLKTADGSNPVAAVIDYPLAEALQTSRGLLVPMLALLGIGLAAAAAGATLIVRRMSRPLGALAHTAQRIAGGDYGKPPEIAQRDEFGRLALAISEMAQAIGERETALKGAREAAEIAREQAVRANEAKSHFLANMSHELRTPLNAVVGFSEMLAHEVLGPIAVRRYVEYAHDIHTSGEKLRALFERMLDVAESGSQTLSLPRQPFLLDEELAAAVDLHRAFARSSGVEFVFHPPSGRARIDGDARRMRHALADVIHNAIKFTPQGGSASVSCRIEGGAATICIADTGAGIEASQLQAVLEPFQRLRSAIDGRHQGAGLGLARAKAVVERHGGNIAIASTIGEGTRVTIGLPIAELALHDAA